MGTIRIGQEKKKVYSSDVNGTAITPVIKDVEEAREVKVEPEPEMPVPAEDEAKKVEVQTEPEKTEPVAKKKGGRPKKGK